MTEEQAPSAWRDFLYYIPRWMLFSMLMGALQPVTSSEYEFWTYKGMQILSAMPFGIVAGAIFTPLQNFFNPSRSRLRFWPIAIFAYLIPKMVFAVLSSSVL